MSISTRLKAGILAIMSAAVPSITAANHQPAAAGIAEPAEHHATFRALSGSKAQTGNIDNSPFKSTSARDILLEEDFSGFTSGTLSNPDAEDIGNDGFIPEGFTSVPGWSGLNIYQAGGCCVMKSDDYSLLNTPLGDYSGALRITFRARTLGDTSASFFVSILGGGLYNPYVADAGDSQSAFTVMNKQGWREFEIITDNYTSDPSGYIQWICYGGVVIDDIKVTTETKFLAPPMLEECRDFTTDGFTITWKPVRMASYYFANVYEKELLSDADYNSNIDFESSISDKLPEGWEVEGDFEIKTLEDGTHALALKNSALLTLPMHWAKYKELSFKIRTVAAPGNDVSSDAMLIKSFYNGESWITSGYNSLEYYCDDWHRLDGLKSVFSDDTDLYYGVRYKVTGLENDAYILIDDMNIVTEAPARLNRVAHEMVDGADTSYQATGLDASKEYFFSVQAAWFDMTSREQFRFAFGLPAPIMLDPSEVDVDNGSFTANWTAVPKATSYNIVLFDVENVRSSESDRLIWTESFNGVDDNYTESTDPFDPDYVENYYQVASFNPVSDIPGWTGINNTYCEGMIGCDYSYEVDSWLRTPEFIIPDGTNIRVEAIVHGYAGDAITVLGMNGESHVFPFMSDLFDETGVANVSFEVNPAGNMERFTFYTENYGPFMLEEFKIRGNVEAGRKIFTPIRDLELTDNSYRFENINPEEYPVVAYAAKALWVTKAATAVSPLSESKEIVLSEAGVSGTNSGAISEHEPEIYTVTGQRVERASYGGVYILRYPDKTIKIIK